MKSRKSCGAAPSKPGQAKGHGLTPAELLDRILSLSQYVDQWGNKELPEKTVATKETSTDEAERVRILAVRFQEQLAATEATLNLVLSRLALGPSQRGPKTKKEKHLEFTQNPDLQEPRTTRLKFCKMTPGATHVDLPIVSSAAAAAGGFSLARHDCDTARSTTSPARSPLLETGANVSPIQSSTSKDSSSPSSSGGSTSAATSPPETPISSAGSESDSTDGGEREETEEIASTTPTTSASCTQADEIPWNTMGSWGTQLSSTTGSTTALATLKLRRLSTRRSSSQESE